MTAPLPPPDFQRLLDAAAPGLSLARAWPLAGGMSAAMWAVEAREPGGDTRRLVARLPAAAALRANPRAAEDEYHVLAAAWRLGLPAPEPVGIDASGLALGSPAFLTAYLEGEMDFALPGCEERAVEAGAVLARIHNAGWSGAGLALDRPALPEPGPAVPPEWARVDQIRAVLAGVPAAAPARLTLLHGDYWPGNWLWRGGRLAGVVDWEDARPGDPLEDLSIARLDLAWIFGQPAAEAFTAAYISAGGAVGAGLRRWDLLAALRLARLIGADLEGWAAYFAPYGRVDITPETIVAGYTRFINMAE